MIFIIYKYIIIAFIADYQSVFFNHCYLLCKVLLLIFNMECMLGTYCTYAYDILLDTYKYTYILLTV